MKKNECNIVRDLMPLVLDRVASDESREIVEEHITACGECRKQYEDMKAEMPEETRTEFEEDQAQFISAVRKVKRQKRRRRIIALVTAAVICFLAVVCGGVLYDRLRLATDQPIPAAEYELILSRLKDGRAAMTFRADKTYSSTAYNERMGPLVMRAVAKSETLALSMELRGFGANTYKNMPKEKLTAVDFAVLAIVVVLSTYPFWKKVLLT